MSAELVGKWLAATNMHATFDLAVHNLWTLFLRPDGKFSFHEVETVSYPQSGRAGHQNTREERTGTWDLAADGKVTLSGSELNMAFNFSKIKFGGTEQKRLDPPGSQLGFFGGGPQGFTWESADLK